MDSVVLYGDVWRARTNAGRAAGRVLCELPGCRSGGLADAVLQGQLRAVAAGESAVGSVEYLQLCAVDPTAGGRFGDASFVAVLGRMVNRVGWLGCEGTRDPSTSLRFGRDDDGAANLRTYAHL